MEAGGRAGRRGRFPIERHHGEASSPAGYTFGLSIPAICQYGKWMLQPDAATGDLDQAAAIKQKVVWSAGVRACFRPAGLTMPDKVVPHGAIDASQLMFC